jgi:hypothetical protein
MMMVAVVVVVAPLPRSMMGTISNLKFTWSDGDGQKAAETH